MDFALMDDCQKLFEELKTYLSSPPLLSKPLLGEDLFLHLSVSDVAVNSTLVRVENGIQKPIYYVSKALQHVEARYPKMNKVALAFITSARKVLLSPEASGRLRQCYLLRWESQQYGLYTSARKTMKLASAKNLDLVEEVQGQAYERSIVIKQWVMCYYSQRVRSKQFQVGDLVLCKLEISDPKSATEKLSPNWEVTYHVLKILKSGAYALETLSKDPIPRTWNVENLRHYY
ncbi:hypothetical protein RJ639_030454 [Escallonia herrerae]|uniref:Reverse transcriptase/retrotransposon-derived protein RNase H-like domain-containing protein n=1 Tax=Escallonia herrerae TaxID=1293975 RepID=A0AA88WZY0_9ASTE|nr:hypothetical protein RJ639_030454 [Escallonia herrerae]